MPTAGYSQTPLARKLGIKRGFRIALLNQPDYYFKLFEDLSIESFEESIDLDFIHLFVKEMDQLETHAPSAREKLKMNGTLWISWPKGSSGVETDLNRDIIRDYVLRVGLVDVKVAAVDETWSGLKFVYRLADRK